MQKPTITLPKRQSNVLFLELSNNDKLKVAPIIGMGNDVPKRIFRALA